MSFSNDIWLSYLNKIPLLLILRIYFQTVFLRSHTQGSSPHAAAADPTARIIILRASVNKEPRRVRSILVRPSWCGAERERRQYQPEDGSHHLQEGSQQHLAGSADTSLYATHLEIIYRFEAHARQTRGGVSRKMSRKKQPTGKVYTCNSGSVWSAQAGRAGLSDCWRSQDSLPSKTIDLSGADPSADACVRAVSVWTAGVWTSNTPRPRCKWIDLVQTV